MGKLVRSAGIVAVVSVLTLGLEVGVANASGGVDRVTCRDSPAADLTTNTGDDCFEAGAGSVAIYDVGLIYTGSYCVSIKSTSGNTTMGKGTTNDWDPAIYEVTYLNVYNC
jgi:hypothetical protein